MLLVDMASLCVVLAFPLNFHPPPTNFFSFPHLKIEIQNHQVCLRVDPPGRRDTIPDVRPTPGRLAGNPDVRPTLKTAKICSSSSRFFSWLFAASVLVTSWCFGCIGTASPYTSTITITANEFVNDNDPTPFDTSTGIKAGSPPTSTKVLC